MALIPTVGRRSARMRALLTGIYVFLTLGTLTTLYPFLVMLGSSVTSDYDQDQYNILPAYLTSGSALAAKYAEDKYDGNLIVLNQAYGTDFATLRAVRLAASPQQAALVGPWRSFFAGLPPMYRQPGFRGASGQYVPSKQFQVYQEWLRRRYHGDIGRLAREYVEEDTNFLTVTPPYQQVTQRLFRPGDSPKERDWAAFQQTLPLQWFRPVLLDPLYQSYLHDEVYPSGKIADLNTAWGTRYTDYSQVRLAPLVPSASTDAGRSAEARDWAAFARAKMPLRFIAWQPGAAAAWARFQAATPLGAGAPIPLPSGGAIPHGPALLRYAAFVSQAAPRWIGVDSLENRWRALRGEDAPVPVMAADRAYALANAGALRREFVARNYRFAMDYLLLHGRGIVNTVIYCVGAVAVALIVNPLCAYALSRFRLPYTTGLLLFLLATMAFPAEVTLIPNFLLLKQLNLLNTFWALILPGAASGFSIFLLKGFFDSLPPELFEAGMLDGAGEVTLFTRVTLPLSGPIFAVIALQAFAAMYGAFLFAMTIEQKQDQWPLMVWIYQFQALAAPNYVIMAALVIAALPTLIVFLFAQNVIMKGVILPSYK